MPADLVDGVHDGTLELRLRGDELEQFPEFAYDEGIFPRAMRVPVEWVSHADTHGNVRLRATRSEIEGSVGYESATH